MNNNENINFNDENVSNGKKGVSSGIVILLSIIIIAIVAPISWMLGAKYSDLENKKEENKVVEKENQEKDELEEDNAENADEKMIKKIYDENIPAYVGSFHKDVYVNEKVTIDNLDSEMALIFTFSKIDFKEGDIFPFENEDGSLMCEEEEGGCEFEALIDDWYGFYPEVLQKKAVELFGKKIKDDSFEVGPGAGVSYENGKYFYSYGGGTTDYWDSYRKMLDYQIEEETLTITDEAIFFYATALMDDNYSSLEKYEVSVFNYTDGTGVVDSFETENPDNINLEKKYKNKTKKFKHTFKKNESGNWYWISTEPVK